MFLISNQDITLILLAICILPIVGLGLYAIIKTFKNKNQANKTRNEKLLSEEKDLEQRKIFFDAYGGEENINSVSLEMNRITVSVKDIEKVDGERLKELGATGVLLVGDLVKASFSDRAKYVHKLMEK
jgi:glucose-like phosphotransferase system IIB component